MDPGVWWVVKAVHAVDRATMPLTQVVAALMLLCQGSHSPIQVHLTQFFYKMLRVIKIF